MIDALPTPPPEAAEFPRLDVNAAGQGLSANARQLQFGVDSAFLSNGTWSGLALSPEDNGAAAAPVPALAESGVGLVAWKPGGATGKTVVARIRSASGFGAQTTLSNPAFGAESSNGLGLRPTAAVALSWPSSRAAQRAPGSSQRLSICRRRQVRSRRRPWLSRTWRRRSPS